MNSLSFNGAKIVVVNYGIIQCIMMSEYSIIAL